MYCKLVKILILTFLISCKAGAQADKISLEEIATHEKIFYGSIADKYDITIYLKTATYSEDHLHAYSVKGWYYYNSVKKPIPLIGVNDPTGGLTLYNLKDKALSAKIEAFDLPGYNVWDKLGHMDSLPDYEEKFTISYAESERKWKSKTKELGLKIYNYNNQGIDDEMTFLKLGKDNINLSDFSINYSGLTIVNSVKTKLETKILLQYEHSGNPNLQGRCGGAMDSGYIILSFNAKNELNFIEEVTVENCREFIYAEEIQTTNKDLIKFKIITSQGDKEVVKKVTVDTKAIAFINEK